MKTNYNILYEKLSRLQWLLQRQQMQAHSQRGPFGDPSRGQGRVLALLKMQPEISTKDLSYLLGIRQQSLNELLNKLAKAGYVVRVPSEADKRVMMVQLTEKGKSEQQEEADFSNICDCLNEEEQEAFGDYLDRIIISLKKQLGVTAEEEEMDSWMQAARTRMGNEKFERLLAMHGRFEHPHHSPNGEHFLGGGFGKRGYGSGHGDMPESEPFPDDRNEE